MTKEEIYARIKDNKDWFNKSYAGYYFGIWQQGRGLSRGAKYEEFAMPYGVLFQNHGKSHHMDWFWDKQCMQDARERILGQARASKSATDSFLEKYKKTFTEYLECWEKVAGENIENLDYAELGKKLGELDALLMVQCGLGYVVDSFLTDDSDWLVAEITSELGDKATPEVVALLSAPIHTSFVNDAELARLHMAAALKAGESEKAEELAREFEKNYFWLKTSYLAYPRFTAADALAEARELANKTDDVAAAIAHEGARVGENKLAKEKLYKELGVSAELQNIIYVANVFTHIQDNRKECVLKSNHLFFTCLESVGRRMGVKEDLMFYLTSEEFLALLGGKTFDWSLAKKRRDGGVLTIFYDDTYDTYYPEEYAGVLDVGVFFKDNANISSCKGAVAFKGHVTGRARIMSTSAQIATFNEGEILITNQTTPEFVPAMKKAAAVVTDQGGITCHAAIVSRELRVPCVIGTKIATKIFKDGDMVEVDANTGVVRKIN